jgi:hypothetical protein
VDELETLRQRRDELIRVGQITQELILIQTRINNIEAERALVAQGSHLEEMARHDEEVLSLQELMDMAMRRTALERKAAEERMQLAEEEAAAKQRLVEAEKRSLQVSVQSSVQSVFAAQNSADAIKSTIRGLIQAELAKAIAKSLGDLGPAALIIGPLIAAGLKALFTSLIPGFATGGTITGPPGTDNVLTRLTPGEEVINARAASENRPLLKRINAGAPASAAMGPMELQVTIGGRLTGDTESLVAAIDNTTTTIDSTRGQIRARQ